MKPLRQPSITAPLLRDALRSRQALGVLLETFDNEQFRANSFFSVLGEAAAHTLESAKNGVLQRLSACLVEPLGRTGRESSRQIRESGRAVVLESFQRDRRLSCFRVLLVCCVPEHG